MKDPIISINANDDDAPSDHSLDHEKRTKPNIYLFTKYDTLTFPSSDEILNLIFNLFIIKDMLCFNTQFLDAIASLDLEHSMHKVLFYP